MQENLRWSCDFKTADKICSFNRHYAEHGGYWEGTSFLAEAGCTQQTTRMHSNARQTRLLAIAT